MSVNRIALGKRISFYRLKFSMTQEKLADLTNCSREYIAYLENGVKTPSLPILVDLANALHISVDALLVDSLDYSLSSSDSDLHRLLLDCNETEQEIIIRTAKELKSQNKKARISRRRTLESSWVLSVVYAGLTNFISEMLRILLLQFLLPLYRLVHLQSKY